MIHILVAGAVLSVPGAPVANKHVFHQLKTDLVNKFLKLSDIDLAPLQQAAKAGASKPSANRRQMQQCDPDNVFCSLEQACGTNQEGADLLNNGFSSSQTTTIMNCVCSNGFDADTAHAMFGGPGVDSVEPLCSNQCIAMVEVLVPLIGRRMEEVETPVLGRLLQASPSPDPSPDPSPSPSPGGDDVDPLAFFLCACEVPEVMRMQTEVNPALPNAQELDALCSASQCSDLISQVSEITCPTGGSEPVEYSVTLTVTAEGTVEDFTDDVKDAMKPEFAQLMGVTEDKVEIDVRSGSVIIDVTITVETMEEAEAVQAVMVEIEEDPSLLESTLAGVTLADGSSLTVLAIEVGEVEVADLSSSVEEDDKDKMKLAVEAIVGIAVGGFVFLVAMITLIVCCCCCKKKEAKAAGTAVPVTMNVVSAASDGEGKV
jgi:hypothetical protein